MYTGKKNVLLCGKAKNAHVSLLRLMFAEESEKQETWFADAKEWLTNGGDVHPHYSISNVASRHSHTKTTCKSSNRSGKSSNRSGKATASSRIKAEGEKAALLA